MVTNFEVRFLLVLWDLGGVAIPKSKLNERFSGKRQEVDDACTSLVESGKIAASAQGKVQMFTLTDAGKTLLRESLVENEFQFKAQIGAKMANALLQWWRLQPSRGEIAGGQVEVITSYESFKLLVLETYTRLNQDFNLDNLVPIYRIRREIGDQVSRANFDFWLLEMQANDVVQLIGGEMPELTPDIAQDSVKTALGAIRYYVKTI
jgi:hypothetical protein